tara:strand:+ start:95 stop:328 length:234 start_codon:yes stop_codon:yes gene_type:complete
MLDFIKKYPMSILLAIIAFNLFSIASSLKTEAKLNKQKLVCLQYKRNHINAVELIEKLKLKEGTNGLNNICDPILKA